LLIILQIRLRVHYRLNSNYRQLIDSNILICEILAGDFKKSVWGGIIQAVTEYIPGLVHSCPYKNQDLQANNVTIPENLIVAPSGDYKINVLIFDKKDDRIGRIIISMRVSTADKKEW